ncbi:unnamed protein product [[Candida] boidinii]|nr:unnamed protein product [[Candida] boidinii]
MTISTPSTVVVIGGPAGTGKTTIGSKLSDKLNCPFLEGDSYHPDKNIKKMSQGIPLTDEDRYPWLTTLTEKAVDTAVKSDCHLSVVSCSMLKHNYRTFIKQIGSHGSNIPDDVDVRFLFLFLYSDYAKVLERIQNRQNHFMKADMLKSQYDIMEIPNLDSGDEFGIYIHDKSIEQVLDEVYGLVEHELEVEDDEDDDK